MSEITSMDRATQLRKQAQELLNEALLIDGLQPRIVIYAAGCDCVNVHLFWSQNELNPETIVNKLEKDFDEDSESITIINEPDIYGALAGLKTSPCETVTID